MKRVRFKDAFGPWAVVTGASDGIGRAMAIEIAQRGVNLVLAARRADELAIVAGRARELGVETRVVAADLATAGGREALISRTADLDVGLFVPAAGFGTSGPFLDAEVATELAMVELNCGAVLALTHHFAARLATRGRGALVLFSSIVAFQGVPKSATYAATKAFNQSLAEALRLELGPHGVDVMALAPATVESGFAARAGMKMGAAASAESVARAAVRAIGRRGTVRPGALATVLELALKLPRWARSRIMAQVMGSMAAE